MNRSNIGARIIATPPVSGWSSRYPSISYDLITPTVNGLAAGIPTNRPLPPHDDQHRVGRPDVALAVRAEDGEGVVSRLQPLDGELGRPLRQLARLRRPVVQLQLL